MFVSQRIFFDIEDGKVKNVQIKERKLTMQYEYKTKGTCSQRIFFDIEDGKVKNVQFVGGCNGNLKGIAALVEGMDAEEVISRVEGIRCGMKGTSCPDQLAKALKEVNA